MDLRWPLISSLAALAAGILVAALVVAFCGGNGEEPQGLTSRTTPTATGTTTRTPRAGSPVATGTPDATPSVLTPAAETPVDGGTPAEGTPEAPPPEESPAPEPTLPPGETPPAPSPTPAAATPTPVAPTGTPRPTATPSPTATPTALPDLVVRDLRVSNDRLVIEIGNIGEGELPAGQVIEFRVRGVPVDSFTVHKRLAPGASVSAVLEEQVIYGVEIVLAVVDPNDVIPEEEELNNGFSKELRPDVPLDFAVAELLAVGPERHLAVLVRNTTRVPIFGADIRLTVFRDGATEASAVARRQALDMEPLQTVQIDVTQQIAVHGHSFRVVMEIMNLPDANPSNNTLEASIP